jgi:hypothetical protein
VVARTVSARRKIRDVGNPRICIGSDRGSGLDLGCHTLAVAGGDQTAAGRRVGRGAGRVCTAPATGHRYVAHRTRVAFRATGCGGRDCGLACPYRYPWRGRTIAWCGGWRSGNSGCPGPGRRSPRAAYGSEREAARGCVPATSTARDSARKLRRDRSLCRGRSRARGRRSRIAGSHRTARSACRHRHRAGTAGLGTLAESVGDRIQADTKAD